MKDHTQLAGTRPINRLFFNNRYFKGRFNAYNSTSETSTQSQLRPKYKYAVGQQAITLLLLLLAAGFVAISFDNALFKLAVVLCLSLVFTSLLFSYRNIRDIHFDFPEAVLGFAGKEICLILKKSRSKNLKPQDLVVALLDADGRVILRQEIAIDKDDQQDTIGYPSVFVKRGVYNVRAIQLVSLFPLGFLRATAIFDVNTQIVISPAPIRINNHAAAAYANHVYQDSQTDMLLKSYQKGDSVSRIHWQAIAAEKGVFVRYLEEENAGELWIDWFDFPDIPLEQRLSHLAFMITSAEESKQLYGLKMPNREIPPSCGFHHRNMCLTMLAKYHLEKT